MGIVIGFIPWIVYWILVGNIPFSTAVTIAFGITLLIQIMMRIRKQPVHTLDIGNLLVFAVLVLAAYLVPDDTLERWLQPLSSLGLLLIALVGVLVGRPFVRDYTVASVDAETAKTDGFRSITLAMTWMWVVALGIMFVSSMIPPIVDGDATILDLYDPLSIICYWVIPYTVLGVAGTISAVFPPWFEKRSAEIDHRTATAPAVVAQPPLLRRDRDGAAGGLTIDVPADTRLDEPFTASIRGGAAGSVVEVTTTGQDLFGRGWRSRACFTVPADGVIDLNRLTPQPADGQDPDWTAPDGTAPIWAMRFDQDDATPEMFVPPVDPWQVTIHARGIVAPNTPEGAAAGAAVSGQRTVLRRRGKVGLTYQPTTVGGLPGMLVLPPEPAPDGGWPAVACFGGSEGGFESQLPNAAVLASHGFAALAQAWISEQDAAQSVSEVPLRRFADALTFLVDHDSVNRTGISAMAISRGSEGLLATVSRQLGPPMAAVILLSPSAVSWQAIGSSGEVPDTASWTADDGPVPWVPLRSGILMRQIIRNASTVARDIAHQRPSLLRLRPAYDASLTAVGLLDRQGRPVLNEAVGTQNQRNTTERPPAGSLLDASKVPCPLLLIAGADDQLWPSVPMAQLLAAQRRSAGLDRDDHLMVCEGAGHLIRLGLQPTDAPWTGGIAFGGTRDGLARAQADATSAIIGFLRTRTASTTTQH